MSTGYYEQVNGAMTYLPNADGSLTITWTVPSVSFTWNPAATPVSGAPTQLPAMTPSSAGSAVQGNPPNAVYYSQWTKGDPYGTYGVLHLQFGADPANTINDYFQTFPHTIGTATLATGDKVTNTLTVAGGSMAVTVPATTLNDSRIVHGIYAIGYVYVNWEDYNSSGTIEQGKWIAAFQYATNALPFQPQPPSAPGNLTGSVDTSGNAILKWNQSTPGTGKITGYEVRWGMTAGGPYPNSLFCPISAYPIGSSSTYTTTVPSTNFALDGSTRYFVVQALDDGSSPTAVTAVQPNSINYFPTNLPDSTATPPPPSDPGGGGNPPGGGPTGPVQLQQPDSALGYILVNLPEK